MTNDDRPTRLATGFFALGTAFLSGLMLLLLRPYPYPHNFSDFVDSPVLALQMSSNAQGLQTVLRDGDPSREGSARRVLGINNNLDLVFIPLYAGFLILFVRLFREVPGVRVLVRFAFAAIGITAVLDYLEDYGIAGALASREFTDGLARPITLPSLGKWGFFGLALLFVGLLLLRSDGFVYSRATLRIQGVLFFLGGAFVLLGLAKHSRIELGIEFFALCVVWNAGALLGPVVAERLPGMRPRYIENFCDEPRGRNETAVRPVRAIRTRGSPV